MDREPIWDHCFELALTAILNGGLGIGVVITKGHRVVAEGFNQIASENESINQIKNNSLAHAEINALNNLPARFKDDSSLELYTTLEPCPMCMGAIAMSKIRKINIGKRDYWAGSAAIVKQIPYLQEKGIEVNFLTDRATSKLFAVLHYYSMLKAGYVTRKEKLLSRYKERDGESLHKAVVLLDDESLHKAINRRDLAAVKKCFINHCSG